MSDKSDRHSFREERDSRRGSQDDGGKENGKEKRRSNVRRGSNVSNTSQRSGYGEYNTRQKNIPDTGVNLLSKLKEITKNKEREGNEISPDVSDDESFPFLLGQSKNRGQNRGMTVLCEMEKTCREFLDDLGMLSRNIEVLSEDLCKVSSYQDEQMLIQEMESYVEQSKGYIRKIKDVLLDLDNYGGDAADSSMTDSSMEVGSFRNRIDRIEQLNKHEGTYCKRILGELGREMQEGVKKMLRAQHGFEENARIRMKHQVHLLYPDATESEIETMTKEDPEALKLVVLQKKKEELGHDSREVENELNQLRDESHALEELQTAVVELNELFVYLGNLVDMQTQKLGSIEESVDATGEYVEIAVADLDKAAEHQASYEAKRSWLKNIVCMAIFVGVVIVSVILFFVLKPFLDTTSSCATCMGTCSDCGGTKKAQSEIGDAIGDPAVTAGTKAEEVSSSPAAVGETGGEKGSVSGENDAAVRVSVAGRYEGTTADVSTALLAGGEEAAAEVDDVPDQEPKTLISVALSTEERMMSAFLSEGGVFLNEDGSGLQTSKIGTQTKNRNTGDSKIVLRFSTPEEDRAIAVGIENGDHVSNGDGDTDDGDTNDASKNDNDKKSKVSCSGDNGNEDGKDAKIDEKNKVTTPDGTAREGITIEAAGGEDTKKETAGEEEGPKKEENPLLNKEHPLRNEEAKQIEKETAEQVSVAHYEITNELTKVVDSLDKAFEEEDRKSLSAMELNQKREDVEVESIETTSSSASSVPVNSPAAVANTNSMGFVQEFVADGTNDVVRSVGNIVRSVGTTAGDMVSRAGDIVKDVMGARAAPVAATDGAQVSVKGSFLQQEAFPPLGDLKLHFHSVNPEGEE